MTTTETRSVDIEVTTGGGPKVTSNASTAAERMRRYRERKRNGMLFMAHVPVYPFDAEAFVKCGRLKPEDEGNREKIAEAVEALVDQFTEGRLVPIRDG